MHSRRTPARKPVSVTIDVVQYFSFIISGLQDLWVLPVFIFLTDWHRVLIEKRQSDTVISEEKMKMGHESTFAHYTVRLALQQYTS